MLEVQKPANRDDGGQQDGRDDGFPRHDGPAHG
jgi:hypothetical protein